MATYAKGDIVLLKHLYPREKDDLRGTDIEKLYKQKRDKLGLIVQTGLNYIDIVFDSDEFISRVPYRYIQRIYRPLNAEYAFGIAPGDVIKLNEFDVTVDYIAIRPVHYNNMVMYYKIDVFCSDGTANDILFIPFAQISKGPHEVKKYSDCPPMGDVKSYWTKNLLKSYWGIDLANNEKRDECICSKQDIIGYGLRATEFYIDELDTIKEDTKMDTKKSAYYPIKKVIFNPPATIVFWENGSKTVVKAKGEAFDPEKGLAMAISRHYLCDICNLTRFDGVFKKYLTKETKEK